MKIAIIGGSSFSTPGLLKYLDSKKLPAGTGIVLAGRSLKRLAAIKRASKLLVRPDLEIRTEPTEGNNWYTILDGADTVVIQIRVGGFEGRLFDETFPNRYGLCGDEGLGAGGLSAGWRTWPFLAPILEEIVRFCPQAFVILLTSPLGPLVRASLNHTDLNLVGICELPWTTLQEMCNSVGVQTGEVEADYIGVNHLGWFFNIRSGSRDLGNEITARNNRAFPNSQLLRTLGCFPTRYLRMHYEHEMVLEEQISQSVPRAEVLSDIQGRSYRTYLRGQLNEINSALEWRATPWYAHALGPLLSALGGQPVEDSFFLSGRNGSCVSFLASDDIVECQNHWAAGGLLRSSTSAPPKHIVENLVRFVQFERVATEAITSRSIPLLREALTIHPWIRDHAKIRPLVEEIVTTNDAILMTGAR